MAEGILLDTHVLLWLTGTEAGRLGPGATDLIGSDEFPLFVSAITPWELQIKFHKRGTPLIEQDFVNGLASGGMLELSITARDGIVAGALPLHHRDPFDRMLVAQCMNHDLMLMTADRDMHRYDIEVFPAGV